MSRILVTGATGSLGSALARHLLGVGADVTALVAPGSDLGGLHRHRGQFRIAVCDVRDRAGLRRAFRGVDEIYHVAGVAILLNRLHREMWQVNALGARAVAEVAAEAGVRRLVHTSSVSAVGYPPDGEVADETFDFSRSITSNSYMLTKRAGEDAVREVGAERGLEVVVVNPAAVIAPYSHRRHGWAALIDRSRRGRLTTWPPGGLAVCSVVDLVAGQLAAMARGRPGQRYILATRNLSYRELFVLVCRTLGRPEPRFGAPATAVRLAGRLGQLRALAARDPLRSPVLVPENADLGVRTIFFDPGKSRRELGLRPTSLTDSILEVDRWLATENDNVRATR